MKNTLYILTALIVAAAAVLLVFIIKGRSGGEPLPRSFFTEEISDEDIQGYWRRVEEQIAADQKISSLFGPISDFQVIIENMNIEPDSAVADIGCGSGLLEYVLLESQQPFGKVYAVDIDKRAVEFLRRTLELIKLPAVAKVDPVLSRMTDVTLPPASVDIAAIVSTTAFNGRIDSNGNFTVDGPGLECLLSLHKALKAGGLIHYFSITDMDKDLKREIERITYPFKQAGFTQKEYQLLQGINEVWLHVIMIAIK